MKSISSIIFLTLLLAISTTEFKPTDYEIDQTLIELNKEPIIEGIFATMATQVSNEGGFNRVLSLLQKLVKDGKEQLHQITKTWKGVSVRCTVSKINLQNKQEFFDNHLWKAKRSLVRVTTVTAEYSDIVSAYTGHHKVYSDLLREEGFRHAEQGRYYKRRREQIQDALKAVETAIGVVTDWTPKGAALVQTMLTKMVESSRSVSLLRDLANPMELIQRSGSDPKVRARALQWLNLLKVRLLGSLGFYADDKTRSSAQKQIRDDLRDLSSVILTAKTSLYNRIAGNVARVTDINKFIKLFEKLSENHKALTQALNAYCQTESLNYNRNKNRINGEIALFREVIKYFMDHYSRIHSFIRAKYNH